MHSKIFILSFSSMLGLTVNLQAQSDKQSSEEKEKQVLVYTLRHGMQTRGMKTVEVSSVAVQTNKYNHREAEIIAKINSESIPEDFPIFKNEYTNEEYTILINKWYTANPALQKKEFSNDQK